MYEKIQSEYSYYTFSKNNFLNRIDLVIKDFRSPYNINSIDEIIGDFKINRHDKIKDLITICTATFYNYVDFNKIDFCLKFIYRYQKNKANFDVKKLSIIYLVIFLLLWENNSRYIFNYVFIFIIITIEFLHNINGLMEIKQEESK